MTLSAFHRGATRRVTFGALNFTDAPPFHGQVTSSSG